MKNILLLALLLGSSPTWSAGRVATEDLRELMLAALNAPDGKAQGVLSGSLAAAFATRFSTDAPLLIDITTLKRYRQPGCARLNLHLQQAQVHLPQTASPRTQRLDIGINYCRDGMPPRSLEEARS